MLTVTLVCVLTVAFFINLTAAETPGSPISLTCIGCDSLPTDDDATYYCPGSDKVLFISCDVFQGGSLIWIAPPLFDVNTRVDFSALDAVSTRMTRGFTEIVLDSVEVGPNGAQNNFSSTMRFNTEAIDFNEFTIICQTGTNSATFILKQLGNLTVPMSITSESTSLCSEKNGYFIFFTWEYSGGIEIKDFTTQLFTDDELRYELSVPANERSSACNITRQESSIYVVLIIANGVCGDKTNNSAMVTFENVFPSGGAKDIQINVGYAVMVVLFAMWLLKT